MRTSDRGSLGAPLSGSPVTVTLVTLNVLVFLLLEGTGYVSDMLGGSMDSVTLYLWGAKYGPAIADGEWWRLVLPIFMHIGWFHLLTNSIGLLIFGSMAERIFGSFAYLAIYLVSGIVGNVTSFVMTPALGAGASGAVFGVIGAFGVYLLLNRKVMGELGRQSLITVAVIIALNIAIGFGSQGIDNAAHVGGLLTGAVMAYLIAPRQRLVLTQTMGDFGAPRITLRNESQGTWWVLFAVAVGLGVAVIGTWIRSQDYPYTDQFQQAGYEFFDFSSGPQGGFGLGLFED